MIVILMYDTEMITYSPNKSRTHQNNPNIPKLK